MWPGMIGAVFGMVAILTAGAQPAEAQRNCRKGIPCGNTCISASKVCRIGSGSARATAERPNPPAARSNPPASLAPSAQTPTQRSTEAVKPAEATVEYPWVGSFADGVYFRASCVAAQDLAPPNRRYFASEAAAQNGGFRRSRVPGC